MSQLTENTGNTTDKARERIMQAALKLFVAKGYAGTSMGSIAVAARVSKSLIFHHFSDKESLWKHVKAHFFAARNLPEDIPHEIPTDQGLRKFLEAIIYQRYYVYEENPDMRRMIAWQALEEESSAILGGTSNSPSAWVELIEILQRQGEIRTDQPAKLIMVSIVGMLMPLTTTFVRSLFKNKAEKNAYVKMIIDNLEISLQPQTP